MEIDLDNGLRLGVAFLALVVFIIAVLSYARRRTIRMLLLAIAFGIYVLKGVFLSTDIFLPEQGNLLDSLGVLADAAFLVLVTLAVFRS